MMDQAEEGHPEDDELEGDSEASEKLIEYAGDVLPDFGCAMNPREFAPYFAGLLPSILQKTVTPRRDVHDFGFYFKSYFYCLLEETLHNCRTIF